MSRCFRALVIVQLFAGFAMILSHSAPASGDVNRGKKIAERFCSVCHETGAGDSRRNADRPASFQEIADTPGMGEIALNVFFRTPHKERPNLSITGDVRDNLIAYITSLKSK